MKKMFLVILFCVLIVGIAGFSKDSQYPETHPELVMEDNGKEFKTEVNEVTWSDNENAGSSLISVPEWDVAKNMEVVEVQADDKLALRFGYTKGISEMKAYEVKESGGTRKATPIEIVDNYIQAPKEKGEYVYTVKVFWGEKTAASDHFASYVIKLNVN